MKINKVKEEIRAMVVQTKIEVDGFDATEKIGKMIINSNHYGQIRVIMLYGITFGGFNVCDTDELSKLTNRPIIVIIEHKPDLNSIKKALMKNQFNWEKKWAIFEKIL
ncbi:MAG: endonuclease dU [Candidatus Helarchaeota archaeon]